MDEFTIVNGVLRFKSSPDFEGPRGWSWQQHYYVYEFTVQASDGGADAHDRYEASVTIEVTNLDEPGTVTLSTLQPQVNVRKSWPPWHDPDGDHCPGHHHLAVVPGAAAPSRALTSGENTRDDVLVHSRGR